MELELFTIGDYIEELLSSKINRVYYFFEEFETEVDFSALRDKIVILYKDRNSLTVEDRDNLIKGLKAKYSAITFKFGSIIP